MSFVLEKTVPANTSESSALSEFAILPPCYIEEIHLVFPAGCAGLVGVWFEYQSNQVVPVNREKVYKGNDVLIPIRLRFAVLEEDYKFYMFAYNDDDTYEHTVTAFININIQTERITQEMFESLSEMYPLLLEGRI
jgi:hypothetical protein